MEFFDQLIYSEAMKGRIYQTAPVAIPFLEGERPLTLYLPPGYETSEESYPIAYLFDGQNIYDDDGTFAGGWNLHKVLDQRAEQGLIVPLVVGIHHGIQRDEELCPWPAEKGQTPRGDYLLDWMINELHGQMLDEYRILEGPENTMVGGSSLGGMLALYAFFRDNEVFGRAMVMSPSLWVGDGAIFDYIAEEVVAIGDDVRLYMDCGALEGDEGDEEEDSELENAYEPHEHYLSEELDDAIYDALPPGHGLPDLAIAQTEVEPFPTENDLIEVVDEGGLPLPIGTDEDTVFLAEDHESSDLIEIETDDSDYEEDPLVEAQQMAELLEAKGLIEGHHFLWVHDPEGEHNEWHWAKRLPIALQFLYD